MNAAHNVETELDESFVVEGREMETCPSETTGEACPSSMLRPLSFTDEALELAAEQLARRKTPNAMIRVGVLGGGCAGMKYKISFEDGAPSQRDRVLERGTVKFVVDRKSLIILAGSVLAVEESGLMSRGFVFQNPKATSTCGCGKSFSM